MVNGIVIDLTADLVISLVDDSPEAKRACSAASLPPTELDSDSEDCPPRFQLRCKDFDRELDHLPMHRYMGPLSGPLLKRGRSYQLQIAV